MFLREPGEHERIDAVPRRAAHGFEGPMPGGESVIGPDGSGVDPLFQGGDLGRSERGAHRRHQRFFLPGDFAEQQTAGDGGLGGSLVVESQPALVRLFAVAHQAARGEQGLDVAGEIGRGLGGERKRQYQGEWETSWFPGKCLLREYIEPPQKVLFL